VIAVKGINIVKTGEHKARVFKDELGNCVYYEVKATHNSRVFIDVEIITEKCRDPVNYARGEYKTMVRIIRSRGDDKYNTRNTLDIIIRDARARKFFDYIDRIYRTRSLEFY